MTRPTILIAAAVVLGLAGAAWGLPSLRPPAVVAVRVTAVATDGSAREVTREVTPAQFIGEYSCGGFGHSSVLVLKAGGRFECKWLGCLGVYGRATGNWSVERNGLKLVPLASDGKLQEQPLGRLRIIALGKHTMLLQERDEDWFRDFGADARRCLHRDEAEEALRAHSEQQYRRLVDAVVKRMEEQRKK